MTTFKHKTSPPGGYDLLNKPFAFLPFSLTSPSLLLTLAISEVMNIWFSYFQNFIIILSRVYNEPIQRPAPSWLVSFIGRALHWYHRGQGFESRTSLSFFRLSFCNCKKCVYNCDDLPSYNAPYHCSTEKNSLTYPVFSFDVRTML